MPYHSTGEEWAVALVMCASILFIVTLIALLFSSGLRQTFRAFGYYLRLLACSVCCMPFQCCWRSKTRWHKFIMRQIDQLDHQVRDDELSHSALSHIVEDDIELQTFGSE